MDLEHPLSHGPATTGAIFQVTSGLAQVFRMLKSSRWPRCVLRSTAVSAICPLWEPCQLMNLRCGRRTPAEVLRISSLLTLGSSTVMCTTLTLTGFGVRCKERPMRSLRTRASMEETRIATTSTPNQAGRLNPAESLCAPEASLLFPGRAQCPSLGLQRRLHRALRRVHGSGSSCNKGMPAMACHDACQCPHGALSSDHLQHQFFLF